MKGGRAPLGYTIIEVMIVLAVSGVTFLIAATFINGKQQKSSFTAGVNEMASRLQDVMEQVTDGRYTDQQITCNVNGSGQVTFTPGGTQAQGQNPDCVFLGKLVHFYTSGTTLPENYEIIPLAQPRLVPNSNPPQPLTDITLFSSPVYDNGSGGGGGLVDLRVQATIPQSLDIQQMIVFNSSGGRDTTNSASIGFMPSLDNADSTGSGAQTLKLIYTPGLTSDKSATTPPGYPDSVNVIQHNHLALAKAVQMCLTDGTRFANIRIGYIDPTSHNVVDQPTVSIEQRGQSGC